MSPEPGPIRVNLGIVHLYSSFSSQALNRQPKSVAIFPEILHSEGFISPTSVHFSHGIDSASGQRRQIISGKGKSWLKAHSLKYDIPELLKDRELVS